jgi:hypothetical protein
MLILSVVILALLASGVYFFMKNTDPAKLAKVAKTTEEVIPAVVNEVKALEGTAKTVVDEAQAITATVAKVAASAAKKSTSATAKKVPAKKATDSKPRKPKLNVAK